MGRLHRRYIRLEGEAICHSICLERELISDPANINDFCTEDEFFGRHRFYSMLDYRYANYNESINQNFRPFKKKR